MTNAVDWIVATPNLGVEFDLAGNEKTRFSILMNGKYNWNTHHSIQPRIVYNVAAGSVEARSIGVRVAPSEGHGTLHER